MKIIIVGCGRNGSGLAQVMSKAGHSVTVADSDPAAFEQLGKHFQGKIVEGIGFDKDVLQKAQIERTDVLAVFTSSDESNAAIARIAKEIYHVPKMVTRLYDRERAEIYKRLGVQTLSFTTWGIKHASDSLSYSTLNQIYSFGSDEAELVRVELPALLAGHRANELTMVGDIHVIAIERDNKALLPTAGTVSQEGGIVYIAAASASDGQLRRLLDKTM